MKRLKMLVVTAFALCAMASCSNEGVTLNAEEQAAEVTSRVEAAKVVLQDSLDQVCQKRMETEVDSLVKAQTK
jgi:cell division protein FtsX